MNPVTVKSRLLIFLSLLIASRSDEESDIEELLAQAPPFNPDIVDLSLFPEHEEGEERDEEGNLVINGVPLKKVDVEPLVLEDYIKEEWPRLEPKVHIHSSNKCMYMYM